MPRLVVRAGSIALLFLGLATGLVLGAFTSSHYAIGQVTVATTQDVDLYICEPIGGADAPSLTGSPMTADLCPGDDAYFSYADEQIFEGTEKAAPSNTTFTWDIRLRNIGSTFALDITSVGGAQAPAAAPRIRSSTTASSARSRVERPGSMPSTTVRTTTTWLRAIRER